MSSSEIGRISSSPAVVSTRSRVLIVDSSILMFLSSNNVQSTKFFNHVSKFDISTTTCHIGSNSNSVSLTSFSYNCSFIYVLFCI